MLILLVSVLVFWVSNAGGGGSAPTVGSVLSHVGNTTSFCWRVELSGSTNTTILACINYDNKTAVWRSRGRNGVYALSAVPGGKFYEINWDLATRSHGVEWNVMNFIAWLFRNGNVSGPARVAEGEYAFNVTYSWTESYAIGTIENGTPFEAKNLIRAIVRVDRDGNPLGGTFTWVRYVIYLNENRTLREKTKGSFEVLGPWGSLKG
ncbi:hypothetical protein JCM16307_14770 [Thermococcus prieurii]